MIYATHITYPSYISLNWGLQLHGLITQVPRIVEVISNRNATYPLVEMIRSKYVWGFVRRVYNDNEIFIGLKEKVVIDGIVHERIALDDILSSLGSCDPSLLEEMVLRLDRSDIKRVGYVCSLGGIELKDAKRSMRNDRNYVRSAYHQGKNEWRVIL
jgi:predicted transcriptional regulator of viral defense system